MTDEQEQFQKELKALVEKYKPEVAIEWGYYGEVEGFNISVGDVIVATYVDRGHWNCDVGK